MQCDCENGTCETAGIHRAGGCKEKPYVKVKVFGYSENLCLKCFDVVTSELPQSDWSIIEFLGS